MNNIFVKTLFLTLPIFGVLKLADNGNGDGDGNGGGEGSNAGEVAKQLEELKSQLTSLKQENEKLLSEVEKRDAELLSPDYLEFLENKTKGKSKSDEDETGKVDFEEMSKKELLEYIEKKHSNTLDSLKGDLEGKLNKLMDSVGLALARVDIELAKMKHSDFDWEANKERFYAKAKENPKWSAERVIKEVKRDLRDEAEAREKAEREKAERERKALTEKASQLVSDTTQRKPLSKEEAAELAYRQVFGNKE